MRRGDWIQTYTGRKFWPLEPRAEDVDIVDISRSLSQLCRFTGHTRTFYSVAEHSVRVSQEVPQEFALWGLLHDASEAYLLDLARPLKLLPELAPYRDAEAAVMRAVCERFGLPLEQPEAVGRFDRVLLRTEQRDLMQPPAPGEDRSDAEPLRERIRPWSATDAESDFLLRFEELITHAVARETWIAAPCHDCGLLTRGQLSDYARAVRRHEWHCVSHQLPF